MFNYKLMFTVNAASTTYLDQVLPQSQHYCHCQSTWNCRLASGDSIVGREANTRSKNIEKKALWEWGAGAGHTSSVIFLSLLVLFSICFCYFEWFHRLLAKYLIKSFLSSAYGVSPGPTSRNLYLFFFLSFCHSFCIQLSRRRRATSRGVVRRS